MRSNYVISSCHVRDFTGMTEAGFTYCEHRCKQSVMQICLHVAVNQTTPAHNRNSKPALHRRFLAKRSAIERADMSATGGHLSRLPSTETKQRDQLEISKWHWKATIMTCIFTYSVLLRQNRQCHE